MVAQPSFHTQRPIIVGDGIESPETITLRYEEEAAARANGEGESPTTLLPMATSTFKQQLPQLHGYADAQYTHTQYPTQSYAQQTENGQSQLNNLAFAASSNAAQYMPSSPGSAFNVISTLPTAGPEGTRIQIKIASQYDFMAMSTASPYVCVLFGSQKCAANWSKEVSQDGGCVYCVTADAPDFMTTGCHTPNAVPLTVVVESVDGQELARVDSAGSFTYHDSKAAGAAGVMTGADQSACEDVMAKSSRSPGRPHLTVRTSSTSPAQSQLSSNSATNTYDYTPTVDSAVAAAQHNFASAAQTFGHDNNMLGPYRSSSFSVADSYSRTTQPPMLRHPYGYGSLSADRYTVGRGSLGHGLTAITRPSLTPSLPAPNSSAPQLVRTSTLQSTSASNPWALYPNRAVLNIVGNLDAMASDWSQQEWEDKRRIVVFRKKQVGGHVEVTFKPVPIDQRQPHSICVSCIWWQEKGECFVTSVDTIHLLEQLAAAPNRFTVEEKNRIRRNLEGFKPATVSKAKADSEEFFKIIMGFGAPKPRNIEKDVKVFPWKILSHALKKIFSKYSASPSSQTLPPSAAAPSTTHMLTPSSLNPSYPTLPPTPGSTTTLPDTSGYLGAQPHASDGLLSPRSLSTTSTSWGSYSSAPPSAQQQQQQQQQQQRAISPHSKMPSPTAPSLRMSSMSAGMPGATTMAPSPVGYDARAKSMAHIYQLQGGQQQQHQQQQHHHHHHLGTPTSAGIPVSQQQAAAHIPRWENYSMAAPDAGAYSSPHSQGQIYGAAPGYEAQRA
ncbi:uncharacterized protein E0L32_003164 [Thyridium curvatum]|uniref:DUF7082 domain-containing protein n=1 Tax=Thyridium curvatum TaxID=1093900 RepID=A0A507BKA6_9PEZI|nr:uncharacterized protein E0L32_003164 [Thyridium curvatum]TPX17521.1 hypothetical protein E0L32_003164 [Thyridium curvatum]